MKKQALKKHDARVALDGAAWNAVRPVANGTIDAAAVALRALAAAMRGWIDARRELADAEADAAKTCDIDAAEAANIAERLRAEADTRRAEADNFNASVTGKCIEVARLHPALAGLPLPLRLYATGEVRIADPVPTMRGEYTPETTDANRAAFDAFRPVLRNAPETDALAIPQELAGATFRMAEARALYDAACKALDDAIAMFRDARADLAEEAEVEVESVAEAVRIQTGRDNR